MTNNIPPAFSISAHIDNILQTQIIELCDKTPDVFDKLIEASLNQTVSQHGYQPTGWRDKQIPFLEWLFQTTICNVANEIIEDRMKQKKEIANAKIIEQLTSPAFSEKLTNQIFINAKIKY